MNIKCRLLLWMLISLAYLSLNFSSYGSSLTISFLDVGQGDAILISSPSGRLILVDGGPYQVIVEKLDEIMPFGQRRVDLVMASHADDDHISGLASVLERYEVAEVLQTETDKVSPSYSRMQDLIEQYRVTSRGFYKGDMVDMDDGLLIKGWWPKPSEAGGARTNAVSQVVSLEYGPFKALLTGDAEQSELSRALVEWQGRVEVLKAPHHGSAGGLNDNLLKKLQPNVAIISSGSDNRYGHPSSQILQLLADNDTQVLRTDSRGTIRIIVNGAGFSIYTEK